MCRHMNTVHILQDARGDQYDACGSLSNSSELINAKCKLTGTTPIIRYASAGVR